MNLYALDRKKLWGLAAAKCSKCKGDLFLKEESDTNVGEECHVSSHKPNHPSESFSRYDSSLTEDERDKRYDNAILLCATCHKVIDNPESTEYTIEKLHQIKATHEAWVAEKLEEDTKGSRELKRRIEEVSPKFDEFVRLKEQEIGLLKQQMAVEEQRMKGDRERVKELLKSRLKRFVSCWEDDKKSISEKNQKRKKVLREDLSEIGNKVKKVINENEKLLPQTIADEANDIADGVINISTKIRCNVRVVNENEDRSRRINQKMVEEGGELEERAKRLIEKL